VDSDLDRLKRAEEIFLGTSDNDDDSDNDNVTDWDEIFIYQTDPLSPNVFPELIEPLEEIEIITQPLAQIQATNLIGNSTFRFSFDDPKTYRRLAGTPVPKRSNFRNNNAFQRALDAYNRNVTNNSEPDFSWQSGTDTADGWSAVEGSSIEFWDGIGVELNGSTSDYGVKQTNSLELGQYKLIWNARGRDDLRANNEFKVTVTYDGDDNPFSTRTVIADSGGTFVEGSLLFSVTSDDPDSEERDVVVAFTPTDPSITLGSILGSVELTKVDDTAVTFITPATDPVSSPLDEGDGQNEFTYDDSEDGVLTINLKATIAGIGTAPQETKDLYVFEIDAITGSTLEWAAANANGKPAFTANSDTITATVTFTTLPTRYDHFGEKNVRIKKGEDVVASR